MKENIIHNCYQNCFSVYYAFSIRHKRVYRPIGKYKKLSKTQKLYKVQ